MRWRWAFVLPAAGLLLFVLVTYKSMRGYRSYHRYFWWSATALNFDPLDRHHWGQAPCPAGVDFYGEDCGQWGPSSIYIRQGRMATTLILSAFPAFFLSLFVVEDLALWGVSEITTFMVSTPLMIFGWFYFLGWLVDRAIGMLSAAAAPSPDRNS